MATTNGGSAPGAGATEGGSGQGSVGTKGDLGKGLPGPVRGQRKSVSAGGGSDNGAARTEGS